MAKQERFEIGNLVVLKSGGPVMTIQGVLPGGAWRCSWFAGKKMENGNFHPDALRHATDEDKVGK